MKDNVKRLLAFVLAAVMLVSLCPTLGVSAATAEPEAEAAQGETSNSYEPWKHGYRLVDVLELVSGDRQLWRGAPGAGSSAGAQRALHRHPGQPEPEV
ncbi:MAG: hypothetical protein ACLSHU_07925 [Oscillospiraceae bacterium]